MRIAVFGVSGMLGSMLVNYLKESYQIIATVRSVVGYASEGNVEYRQFDCQDFKGIEPGNIVHDSDWVINAIGAIPQRCKDRNTFYAVNANFPLELSKYRKPVIQIATDCVWAGKAGPYLETDKHDEISDYGQSKSLGEIDAPNFYNLRCSIIGLEPEGNYSLLKWFLSQPKKAKVEGYVNHWWNGITTLHFAMICKGIIDGGTTARPYPIRTQHIVPADWISKYKLLQMIAREFGRPDIKIIPIQNGEGILDRRLATVKPELNSRLWRAAGYPEPPTIERMIKELAEYVK
jgi:dTDP-4-dehydrorhamnose reductase